MGLTDDRHRLVGIGFCTKGIVRDLSRNEPAVIGRQADCAVAIVRASDGAAGPISRCHAVVENAPDAGWRIRDGGSTNGTALLRQGIPPTVRLQSAQWYPLESGDVIELAGSPDYQFVFQTVPARASAGGGGTQLLLRTNTRAVQQLVDGQAVAMTEIGRGGARIGRQVNGGLWLEPADTTWNGASTMLHLSVAKGVVAATTQVTGARINQRPLQPGVSVALRDKDLITIDGEPGVSFLFLDPGAVETRSLSDLLLGADRVTFGTAPDNSCRLGDPSISRHHALVWREADQLRVRDLGSANGTVVDERRIFDDTTLTAGSRLWFGRLPFVVDAACWNSSPPRQMAIDIRFAKVSVQIAGKLRLREVSVSIAKGEMVGVLGPSASGKSTLLRALAGQQRIVGGDIYVNGRSIGSAEGGRSWFQSVLGFGPDTREVGFVQQIDLLQPDLTVKEILQFAGRQMGLAAAEAGDRANWAGEMCNLGTLLDRVALSGNGQMNLSGGQLKRVCVALEVLRQPRVLVLDEPTTGQDPKNTNDLMNLFRRLAQEDVTLLMSTHDLRNLALFDKVIVLCLGHLAYFGSPDAFPAHFGASSAEEVYESLPDREDRLSEAEGLASAYRAQPLYQKLCGVDE